MVPGMHDVTEGGVLGAVWECARFKNRRRIVGRRNTSAPVTLKICDHYKLITLDLFPVAA